MTDKKDPHAATCQHCRYFHSMVGIGYGMRCAHPENKEEMKPGKWWKMRIPSRYHSCQHFEKYEPKAE